LNTSSSRHYQFGLVGLFLLLHLGAFLVVLFPLSARWLLLAAVSYSIRMFGITAGYHRYFSHRSYKLGRVAQFAMAFLAQSSGQKGVLWWAAHHRLHHRESDRDLDVHSPARRGFWWAHVGWVLSNDFDQYDPRSVGEFHRFPEIQFLDRHHWVPTVVFGAVLAIIGGWPAFLWGYLVSTVVLYHCTFAINSLAHLWGTRRFDTPDESRNNFWLALVTFGEGWHNNHHYSPGSCRQGERWWELDITYLALKALSWFGIVRELRPFRSKPAMAIPDAAIEAAP
jgi:stearoyl-CoA desaturase (delta-9 desaturase)